MTSIKCKKCKKEVSGTAKFCPYCGESTAKIYCRNCGHEMSVTSAACPACGSATNQNVYNNPKPQYNYVDPNKGEKYEIALVALITSFFVPIAGLVLGIMALNANKGKKNDARTMGLIATIISSIEMILVVLVCVLYFFIFFMAFALA